MLDILATPEAQAVVLVTVLLIMSTIGWYVVARFRGQIKDDEPQQDLMAKFGEMHHRGDLSQAEYRTIKAMLKDKPPDELSGFDKKG